MRIHASCRKYTRRFKVPEYMATQGDSNELQKKKSSQAIKKLITNKYYYMNVSSRTYIETTL